MKHKEYSLGGLSLQWHPEQNWIMILFCLCRESKRASVRRRGAEGKEERVRSRLHAEYGWIWWPWGHDQSWKPGGRNLADRNTQMPLGQDFWGYLMNQFSCYPLASPLMGQVLAMEDGKYFHPFSRAGVPRLSARSSFCCFHRRSWEINGHRRSCWLTGCC